MTEDKIIQTSCPFPVLEYKEAKIKYKEIKQVSGIEYILLEIISSKVDGTKTMQDELLSFSIPEDLHPIFAKAMSELADPESKLVNTLPSYTVAKIKDIKNFRNMRIGDFNLTEKGSEMFIEKMIPTGKTLNKPTMVSYSPVTRLFSVGSVSKLWMYNTALGDIPGFQERITGDLNISEDMEEFVRQNKTKFGISEKSDILSVEPDQLQWKAVRVEKNLTITIGADGASFDLANKDEAAFFWKYYTPETVEKILLKKDNYKFKDGTAPAAALGEIFADSIYTPSEYDSLDTKGVRIYLDSGEFGFEWKGESLQPDPVISLSLLGLMDPHACFALMDMDGCRYFCAYNAELPCPQFGGAILNMQLLAENRLSPDEFKVVLDEMYGICVAGDVTDINLGIIAYIADFTNDSGVLKRYTDARLSAAGTEDEKIRKLIELDDGLSAEVRTKDLWTDVFKAAGNGQYRESLAGTTAENIRYKRTVLATLRDRLGIDDRTFISDIAAGILEEKGPLTAYEKLEDAGFKDVDILYVNNVIEPLMLMALTNEPITSSSSIARDFNNLRVAMWMLNGMLGISSNSGIIIQEDYYAEEFITVYVNFKNDYEKVIGYRDFAPEEYKDADAYEEIYTPVQEVIAIEKAANEHPENITRASVNEYIKHADYKSAVCDLLARLCHDLRRILGKDEKAKSFELINAAADSGLFTQEEYGIMHALRDCRNDYQHSERERKMVITKDNIGIVKTWEDMVFSIADIDLESEGGSKGDASEEDGSEAVSNEVSKEDGGEAAGKETAGKDDSNNGAVSNKAGNKKSGSKKRGKRK